jgi:hypothetical protein
MLKVIRRFGKYCIAVFRLSMQLMDFLAVLYVVQAELDLILLISGAEERTALDSSPLFCYQQRQTIAHSP